MSSVPAVNQEDANGGCRPAVVQCTSVNVFWMCWALCYKRKFARPFLFLNRMAHTFVYAVSNSKQQEVDRAKLDEWEVNGWGPRGRA